MSVFQCSKFSAADINDINAGCYTDHLHRSIINGNASSKELAGLKAFAESRAGLAENDAKKYWNSAKVLISITSVAIAGLCAVGSIYGTVLFATGYAMSACGLLGYLGFVYYDAKCAIETTKSHNFKQIALDAACTSLWASKFKWLLSELLIRGPLTAGWGSLLLVASAEIAWLTGIETKWSEQLLMGVANVIGKSVKLIVGCVLVGIFAISCLKFLLAITGNLPEQGT